MRKIAQNTVVLRDKELKLVRRPGTENWQIHCKLASLKTWHRKTTGTNDVNKAKEQAEDFMAEVRLAERRGYPVISKKFKAIAEILKNKIEHKRINEKLPKLHLQYPAIIDKYLIPFFGNYNIEAVNTSLVNKFHAWRRDLIGRELKKSTQHTHNLVLTMVFNEAIELGYMTEHTRPSLKNTGEDGEDRGTFTHEELIELQKFLVEWVNKTNDQRSVHLRELLCLYVAFVACTGARAGTELRELKWKHIEFKETKKQRVIHISIPQGKVGARQLIARQELWTVLEKLKQLQSDFEKYTLDELIAKKIDEYLFRMRNGKRPYNLVHAFKEALTEANMLTNGRNNDVRTLYSLRHYYATQRLYEGMSYAKLEEQMGTSSKMLKNHYKHLEVTMIADELAGEVDENNAELMQFAHPAKANMMNLLGVATGIYLALNEQNAEAKQELEQKLLSKTKN
jgi:integrase